MTEDAKAIARRFFDEAVNGGKVEVIDELVAADFIEHEQLPELSPGRDGVKEFFGMAKTAFPDFQMVVEDIIAEGDKAVVRSYMTGTHKGEFMGIPATGRSLRVQVIDILRVSGGKVAEHWGAMDSGAMMEQLGVAPPG